MAKQGLVSIGTTVTVGEHTLNYVQELPDVGGSPSELDATCLNDSMKHYVPGVQDTKSGEFTYLFDNSDSTADYRALKALQDAGDIVTVTINYPDGTKVSCTGYVSTYIVGVKVDEIVTAKLIVMYQSDWAVTNPTI